MCRPGLNPNRKKLIALWVVGILTTIYVLAELALAIMTKSLVLLSDGFHNLSDVVSIGIAYWSIVKSDSGASDTMSFGWKRTEVVGALINACSLLALCLYILLEAIPRFVHPEKIDVDYYFLGIAGAGICVNLIGTIVFYITGTHAHAHAHDEAEEIEVDEVEEHADHDHVHGEKKKHKKHDHSHEGFGPSINAVGDDHVIGLHNGGVEGDVAVEEHVHGEKKDKKKKKSHSHDHGHDHSHDHDHDHKKHSHKAHKHDHDHEHDHKHDHHGHGHSHSHDHSHGGHGHSHDMNMWAVFIHYLGDAVSSVFVLITGILVFKYDKSKWALYLDPLSSLIIVAIMLYSTIPLVRQCALILLQRVPTHVNLGKLREKLNKIPYVHGVHDLHVWCLVDGMTICTVHVAIDSPDNFDAVAKQTRKLFHKFNIHSSTIQPEYPAASLGGDPAAFELQALATRSNQLTKCEQNCSPDCKEDWCCKTAPKQAKQVPNHGALDFDPVFNPREPAPPRLSPPPGDRHSHSHSDLDLV